MYFSQDVERRRKLVLIQLCSWWAHLLSKSACLYINIGWVSQICQSLALFHQIPIQGHSSVLSSDRRLKVLVDFFFFNWHTEPLTEQFLSLRDATVVFSERQSLCCEMLTLQWVRIITSLYFYVISAFFYSFTHDACLPFCFTKECLFLLLLENGKLGGLLNLIGFCVLWLAVKLSVQYIFFWNG